MSPLPSQSATTADCERQVARMPRKSDGVGSALRQVYGDGLALPADWRALLSRINDVG